MRQEWAQISQHLNDCYPCPWSSFFTIYSSYNHESSHVQCGNFSLGTEELEGDRDTSALETEQNAIKTEA